ncbi:MAG: DUF4416 family protein [Acidobacteria bacterium]|jgi:hypothetical protein|nr:DUF4416 family protein [Acidobacteriota bacterium]
MSRRGEFKRAKYFCGLIYRCPPAAELAIARLQKLVSEIDNRSAVIPFSQTPYYRAEMGEPLFRQFVSFRQLLGPERLVGIKIAAMQLEAELAEAGKRTVNLDPGYLSEANVIIATAKNHYHRVPLADGIYAHMEYVLKDGRIQFLPWTYPDFQTAAYLEFFNCLKEAQRLERRGG